MSGFKAIYMAKKSMTKNTNNI